MSREKLSSIAVVGVSAIFPGSVDKNGFWKDVLAGTDQMREIPESHWLISDYYDPDPTRPDKTYAKRGAFVGDVDFDPMEWGIPPSIVPATDTVQLLSLIVAKQVLEDAFREQFSSMDRDRMSCILGVTSAQELLASMVSRLQRPVWVKALREEGVPEDEVKRICDRIVSNYADWQESTFPGLLGNVVAGRIANRIGIGGTNCVTDAACASSFSALSMAMNELMLGQSDVVICGGADTMNDIFMYMCFSKTPALSPSGDCRPFSDKADGTMLGEGFGMVALKRLEDAERDGDRVYAVIKAVGSSSDGRAKSVYAPVAEGQAKALRRAYSTAGYGPETVELVEAHGTGTKAGDAAEFGGLCMVFDESGRKDRQWCQIGSVKSQIGHTKAAAGAAGLLKAVLSLHHRVLPPTIKVDAPNPKLELEKSPFHVTTRARPWARSKDFPRRASVSSFGFGGSNFHVVVEEYQGKQRAYRSRVTESEALLFCGDDANAIRAQIEEARAAVREPGMLRYLASSTQASYDASKQVRLGVVATEANLDEQLDKALPVLAKGEPVSTPGGISLGKGPREGDVAFLFPGQGSQYLDMGASVAMTYEDAIAAWDLAASLDFAPDVHLPEVVFPKTAFGEEAKAAQQARLTATEWAQPAIGCASLALLNVMRRIGVAPSAVGGHSFGEVTALHAAGVLSAEDFLRVARQRGERMRDAASKPGSMTAVTVAVEVLRAKIAEWGIDVVVANHNAPDQVVLSGETHAIDAVEAKLKAEGMSFKRLNVATAFHWKVVADSAQPFFQFLESVPFAAPAIDVYANATASPYAGDAGAMRTQLAQQITEPVRFVEMIERMYAAGVRTFVEVGPGSVLTSLTGRILKGRPYRAIALDRSGRDAVTSLHFGLVELAAAGVAMKPAVLLDAFEPALDPRKKQKPKLALKINGANYGKPYPPKGGAAALPSPRPPRAAAPVAAAPAPVAPAPAAPVAPVAASKKPNGVAVGSNGQAATFAAPSASLVRATAPVAPAPVTPTRPSTSMTQRTGPHPSLSSAWLEAYQQTQLATAQAHAAYQKAMAETHAAFLRASETAILGLVSLATGKAPELAPAPLAFAAPTMPTPAPLAFAAPTAPAPAPAPVYVAPAPAPAPAYVAPAPAPAPAYVAPAPKAAPAPAPTPTPKAAPSAVSSADLQKLMMDIVADKTGYPVEMLALTMDLEADLGVDSIKRVEILSAMRERAPSLPDMDAGEMAKLRTLAEIVAFMQSKLGAPVASASPSASTSAPTAAPTAAPAARTNAVDLQKLMLEIVADKTGYPSEMLALTMDLEADLGVDSIKRVEILSAMREKAPSLPDVEPGEMAKLRTLGQIVEYIDAKSGGPSAAAGGNPSGKAQAPQRDTRIGRYPLRLVASPARGFALRGLLGCSRLVITDDERGIAEALAAALAGNGVAATVVKDVPADADGVIFLGGLRDVRDANAAVALNLEAFRAAKSAGTTIRDKHGVFVTVQDTGGDFGLSGSERAWLGGLTGLVKTLAQEWPDAGLRAIDVACAGLDAKSVADLLVAELLRGGVEIEVAYNGKLERRTTESFFEPAVIAPLTVNERSVVVASGGARGVTAECLIALAASTHCRVVLFGRTALADEPAACREAKTDAELKRALLTDAKARGVSLAPAELGKLVSTILASREVRSTMMRIAASGGDCRYVVADVQDGAAVKAALAEVRAVWGPITGIVHGAGVLADKLLVDKTEEQFRRVFDTKVAGLRVLLDATRQEPIDTIVLFSSVAARCGNQGQCDYAMANEVLNKVGALERARRGDHVVVKSIGWGPWQGGMVTPQLAARFDALGVALIPLEQGAAMMVEELSLAQAGEVEIVIGGEPKAEALLAESATPFRVEVQVSRASHPYLDGHRVKGKVVVPVVLALELFARAASAIEPGQALAAVRDVKVMKGIVAADFERGVRLVVKATKASSGHPGVYLMELTSPEGIRHYRATVELAAELPKPGVVPTVSAKEAWVGPVYGGSLFHGESFQVIKHLGGVSREGMKASLVGARGVGWPEGAFATDPALLDGGLQLALLWTQFALGGQSLPTAIESLRVYRPGLSEGTSRMVLKAREVRSERALCDVCFVGDTGSVIAELRGVETHTLAGSRVATA